MNKYKITTSGVAAAIATLACANANAQGCISGNCENGYGVYQDQQCRYTGFFANGQSNGYGVLHYASGDCYIGQFENGKFTQKGTYYWEDGTRYIGDWLNGNRHGYGLEIQPNGKSNEDIYVNDEIDNSKSTGCVNGDAKNGYNVFIYDDGSKYEGYNKKGLHDGYGTLHTFDGSVYTGHFSKGKYDGYGILTLPDGSKKEGIFEMNRFVGEIKNQQGCISGDCQNEYSVRVEGKNIYIGEFKNGEPHGMGKYIMENGSVYNGTVEKGKIEGYGQMDFFDDGSPNCPKSYIGEMKGGKAHGYGAMTFKNGDIYYGHFEYNKFNGQGVYKEKDGDKKKIGIYRDGELRQELEEKELDLIYGSKNGFGIKLTEVGRYNGNLMLGIPSGQGMMEMYDGTTVIGEFDEGAANGQCVAENRLTGIKYMGQMKNNKITGRGIMEYADGTKDRGYFKDGKLSQEQVSDKVARPQISWTAPQTYISQTTEGSVTVKICVSSQAAIDEVAIFVNGVPKVKKATRGYSMKNSLCDYAFEFDVPMEPGRNEIKALVKNEGGSSVSDPRYVNWDQSDQISNQKRIALIIGNSDYQNVSKLANAANDAKLMGETLKQLGFETMVYTNIDRSTMKNVVYQFGDKLEADKAVGLFFYAGHGIQVDGANYLVPTTASLDRKEDVEDVCFNLQKITGVMEYAGNDLNIIILDACRNNPFASTGTRAVKNDGDGGLAQVNAPKGTLIAYSTAPGKTASDGTGNNGLYTEQLAKAVMTPGFKLEDVFKQVRNETYRISRETFGEGKEQIPWENSSVFGDFYFIR
ncbi:MAG: caspase family protein [Bacteroidales bacterium]|nr:caspase family protein [Bacteroidales bacterium]